MEIGLMVAGFGRGGMVPGLLLRVRRRCVRGLLRRTLGAVGFVDVVTAGLVGRMTLGSPSVADNSPSVADNSPSVVGFRLVMSFWRAVATLERMLHFRRCGSSVVVVMSSSATSLACSIGVGV